MRASHRQKPTNEKYMLIYMDIIRNVRSYHDDEIMWLLDIGMRSPTITISG